MKSLLESYSTEAVSNRDPQTSPTKLKQMGVKESLVKACPFPKVTTMCCQVEKHRDRTFIQLCGSVTRAGAASSSLHKRARAWPRDRSQLASRATHPLQVQLPEFAQSLFALLGGQLLGRRRGLLFLRAVYRHLRWRTGWSWGRLGFSP